MKQHLQKYIDEMDKVYQESQDEQDQGENQTALFSMPTEENLIRWQLDLKEDLNRIYHLLKGNQPYEDKDGSIKYRDAGDDQLKPFNDKGVNLIMNIMTFYLNRNTLLSNYDAATIDWKVRDFMEELIDLIYNKYEEMGMDSPDKIKLYPMVVLELTDSVHSAYLRAYRGMERESLRTARTVTQMDPVGGQQRPYGTEKAKKFSIFKPTSWV